MACYDAIPNKLDEIPVGVTYSRDDEGEFLYVCGAEVHAFGKRPAELIHLKIPAGRYAVFEHRGHVW